MRGDKYVIVHVDDSPTARELVRESLVEAGFEVHSAEDAQSLERLLLDAPDLRNDLDLLVLDMEMPDMMGAQVGAVVMEVYPELERKPFIIYSGKDEDWVEKMSREVASMSEAFTRNFKGYQAKEPGAAERLVRMINSILKNQPGT